MQFALSPRRGTKHRHHFGRGSSKIRVAARRDRDKRQTTAQRRRSARGGDSLRRLGHEQGVRDRSRLCRRGLCFVLAHRRDVRAYGACRHQLHDHLPPLSGRRRWLRERTASKRSNLDRRGVLLIADYLVTAAISALSAFQYLGVPHPERFAAVAILLIGLLNLLGPRHTGGIAFLISVPTAIVVVVLGLFSIPHIGEAFTHVQPLHGSLGKNWAGFVGIVLALSGVEAIANATGVMKLDPGVTEAAPSVSKTSTPAILWVMIGESLCSGDLLDITPTLGASRLILGAPKRNAVLNLLRGNVLREVLNGLPEEIDLLVYA
jgi:hypothetical protein